GPRDHLLAVSLYAEGIAHHLHLPSFPTRRSSDLETWRHRRLLPLVPAARRRHFQRRDGALRLDFGKRRRLAPGRRWFGARQLARSEEHTSELQSRRDIVCRLLLEKKKKSDEG